jgi:glycosyltransferase involved in cell wall biosynthesis
VLPYVERLAARGLDVTLHSFEKGADAATVAARLDRAGVHWVQHPFGGPGRKGGVRRVAKAARVVRGRPLVHARSDKAAAAAMLGRAERWIWDLRGMWREERIDRREMDAGSPEDHFFRRLERAAARRSSGIVTLTADAIDVLAGRYGERVTNKTIVITTCVDVDRFTASPLPQADPVRLLLAGTLGSIYNVPAMLRFADRLRARRPTELHVLSTQASPWTPSLEAWGATFGRATPAEMPGIISAHHAGLSIRDTGPSAAASMPTKIGEFLAVGRPVIVHQGPGDIDRLVHEYDCGVAVPGEGDDIDDVVDTFERLLDDPGTPDRCRRLAVERFNLDTGVDRLVDLYRRAVNNPAQR